MTVKRAFPLRTSAGVMEWLDAQALNGAASTTTVTVTLPKDATKVKLLYNYTYNSGTSLTATPTQSSDGTNYVALSSRAISAGASTVSPLVETLASGANAHGTLDYSVAGIKKLKVVFACASAAEADTLTVYVVVECER